MFGPRTYTPATHDHFHEVATLFVNLASFNAATESFSNSTSTQIPNSPGHTLNLMGRIAHVTFPVYTLMHGVVQNAWPTGLELTILPASVQPHSIPNGIQLQSNAILNMIVQLVGAAFLKYYERNANRPRKAFPKGPQTWPDLWRFAWLLRNAIAHGDTWAIDDPSFPVTQWKSVSVAPKDSGNPWFDITRYIAGGDVLLLMEELNASNM